MKLVKLLSAAGIYLCFFAYNSGWISGDSEGREISMHSQIAETYIIPLMQINGIQVRPEDLMETP